MSEQLVADDVVIEQLSLTHVRSHESLTLNLTSSLTVFVAPNGVGKTNILEAAAMLLRGTSPRTSSELDIIRHGESTCRIAGVIRIGEATHRRDVQLVAGRGKQLRLDEQPVRSIDVFAEATPACVFLPERLLTLRGAPMRRRAIVDELSVRLIATARHEQQQYQRALRQRNELLRNYKRRGAAPDAQLASWNEQLAAAAATLRAQRAATLEQIAEPFRERLFQLTRLRGAHIEIARRGGDDPLADLQEQERVDVRRGSTTTGPHLDELHFMQGERNLRTFGSTGEQRAALLAFTLASADVTTEQTGRRPVLILDEPWAELDAQRRELLSDTLQDAGQVLTSATEAPEGTFSPQTTHIAVAAAAGDRYTT